AIMAIRSVTHSINQADCWFVYPESVNSWCTPEAVVHTERRSGLAGTTDIETLANPPE
ncbi:hypothetical protein KUCAC02_004291, partial [Chaenocephalus aceratus]